MQAVAMSWLVYRVTGSALLLGVAAGAQQQPVLFDRNEADRSLLFQEERENLVRFCVR